MGNQVPLFSLCAPYSYNEGVLQPKQTKKNIPAHQPQETGTTTATSCVVLDTITAVVVVTYSTLGILMIGIKSFSITVHGIVVLGRIVGHKNLVVVEAGGA